MHLWKHPNSGSWYVRDQGSRTSLKTKDRATALSRLEDYRRAPSGALLASDVQTYMAERSTAASHDQMVIAWRHLEPFFGHLRHDQITRNHCRAFMAYRLKVVKAGTVARELSVLKAAVRYCHPNSPAQFEVPPAGRPRDRRLTRDEFKRLLDACDIPHVKLFIVLTLSTGARRSAILELTWDRVDMAQRRVDLRRDAEYGKGRAVVPMTILARDALAEAFDIRQSTHVIEYAGRPVSTVKRGFARAASRAGLKGVTPHVLRHTAASWMAEAGVPMSEIAAYLGHKDSRITERVYAKFSPSYLAKAAQALELA